MRIHNITWRHRYAHIITDSYLPLSVCCLAEAEATPDVSIASFLLVVDMLSRILWREIELWAVEKVTLGKRKYLLIRRICETGSSTWEIYLSSFADVKVRFESSKFISFDCLVGVAFAVVGEVKVTLLVLIALMSSACEEVGGSAVCDMFWRLTS